MQTRRHVLLGSLSSFAAYALLAEAARASAFSQSGNARRWIARQDEIARALAGGEMSQLAWHAEIGRLASEVDIAELMSEIARAELIEAGAPHGRDPKKRFVKFAGEDGAPQELAYGAALFAFQPDSVITPHAHRHMASAHLVIEGKVRVRTFDRVASEAGALIIRPTGDHVASVGEAAAMTSAKDNVHWFTPQGGAAMTFDVIIDGLDAGEKRYVIEPVDPLGGEELADGTIRTPILSFDESMRRYSAAL
jgi:hypothetical protein